MLKSRILTLVVAVFVFGLLAAPAAALADPEQFVVMSHGQSSVRFSTDAPLETIVGNTSAVSGEITFDKARPNATRGRVVVDLATVRTGNDMRDEHMRSAQWLNTAQFPQATLEIVEVTINDPVADNRPIRGRLRGRLTLHGVTREVTADLTGTYVPLTPAIRSDQFGFTGNILRVRAAFRTHFTDHGMQVPQMLILKVSNDIDIEVNLTFVAASAPPSAAPRPSPRPIR